MSRTVRAQGLHDEGLLSNIHRLRFLCQCAENGGETPLGVL